MSSVIHHPGYFTSLPGHYYTSPEVFAQEIAHVFERQWIYAGHVSQVREPGDYVVQRAGTESLILTRDKDGAIRAFFNVCRHRGSQLCEPLTAGAQKQIVCPYHRWSWGLDGRMLGAPGSRDGIDFDYADWPLHEAQVDTFHGTIYVWLGREEAPPLREALGEVDEERLERIEPERIKLAHEERYMVRANWKLMLENNCECYHCAGTHPSLGIACDYQGFFLERDEEGVLVDKRGGGFPLREGMKTFSMDGEWVSKRLLGTPQEPGFSVGWITVPMFAAIAYFADHGVNVMVNPVDHETTELWCQWFVHEDAVEGVDYEVGPLMEVFHVTNLEDIALTEANHRGTSSRRFVPGPNSSTRENFLEDALGAYLQLMGEPVEVA